MIKNLKALIIGNLIVIGLLMLLALSVKAQTITIPNPFTVQLVAPPPTGPFPFTSNQVLTNITQSGASNNNYDCTVTNGYSVSTNSFPGSSVFQIIFTASTIEDGIKIGIATTNTAPGNINDFYACLFTSFTATSGKFIGHEGTNYYNDDTMGISQPPFGRIRGDGTNVYLERSFDGGVTWNSINTAGVPVGGIPEPTSPIFLKMFGDGSPTQVINVLVMPAI